MAVPSDVYSIVYNPTSGTAEANKNYSKLKVLCETILKENPNAELPKIILELVTELEALQLKNTLATRQLDALTDPSGKKLVDIVLDLSKRVEILENKGKDLPIKSKLNGGSSIKISEPGFTVDFEELIRAYYLPKTTTNDPPF